MTPRATLISDILAAISLLFANITVWQEQIEWGLRTCAALVAIAAGVVALWQRLKKKHPSAPYFPPTRAERHT